MDSKNSGGDEESMMQVDTINVIKCQLSESIKTK